METIIIFLVVCLLLAAAGVWAFSQINKRLRGIEQTAESLQKKYMTEVLVIKADVESRLKELGQKIGTGSDESRAQMESALLAISRRIGKREKPKTEK